MFFSSSQDFDGLRCGIEKPRVRRKPQHAALTVSPAHVDPAASQFGAELWERTQLVMATLRGQYGIHLLDLNPGNITFGEAVSKPPVSAVLAAAPLKDDLGRYVTLAPSAFRGATRCGPI